MANFLVIGKHFSDLRAKLALTNHRSILLLDSVIEPPSYLNKVDFIVCDFSSHDSILAALGHIDVKIDGVINLYEQYILPTSFIAARLGLLGLPPDVAEACNDKLLMRQRLAKAPRHVGPAFAEISSEADIKDFCAKYGLPVIIKPAHLSKSLLVSKCDSLTQALQTFRQTLARMDQVYARYAPTRQPRLLIEQFMQGPMYAVDGFTGVDGRVNLIDDAADVVTGNDIGLTDNFLYSRRLPTSLARAELDEILEVTRLGIESLGISNSVTHTQLIMTDDGPKIIEVAARIGGYRAKMQLLAHGVDMMDGVIATALGQPADAKIKKNEPCATIELFPSRSGTFNSITGQDRLTKLPSLKYFIVKQPLGHYVGKASEGYKMCAIVILHNADRRQFEADFDFVNKHVKVVTS